MSAFDSASDRFDHEANTRNEAALYAMVTALRDELYALQRGVYDAAATCRDHEELRDELYELTRPRIHRD